MTEREEPRVVGRALNARKKKPKDPQTYLWNSNHPYSPFVGNALKWDSYVYDDGTTYEGLTREDAPHMKGVLVIGNGTGGGLQDAQRGDKYEGEFMGGYVHGLGQYTSATGEVYRGEWVYGKKHGCGALINNAPFLKKVDKGLDPEKAWESTMEEVDKKTIYGTWQSDQFLADPDPSGTFCHMTEIKGVLQELDSVVTRARMFTYKPDGDVTLTKSQDAHGLPAPLMQDPIHYPHGTKFMAPGPMGQCFPLPEDENLKEGMLEHARNYERIYNMYNFDVEPAPGSDMAKAQALWDKKEAAKKARRQRQQELERRRQQRLERSRRRREGKDGNDEADPPASDATAAASENSAGGRPRQPFASIGLGLGRAAASAGSLLQWWEEDAQRRVRPLFPQLPPGL